MDTFYDVADGQGWNEASRLIVVLRFIREAGLEEALAAFAREQAADENTAPRGRYGAQGWESGPDGR